MIRIIFLDLVIVSILIINGCASGPILPTRMVVSSNGSAVPAPTTEFEAIDIYFARDDLDPIEGIWTWDDNKYQIAIVKNNLGIESQYEYVGIVVRAKSAATIAGNIKLLISPTTTENVFTGEYIGGQTRKSSTYVLENRNLIKISHSFLGDDSLLIRDYPVGLRSESQGGESQGTCFVVGPNGVAITSYHVIDKADQIFVTLADGRKVSAVVEKSSALSDLAVLRLAVDTPDYLSFTSSRSVSVGDEVFTVGYPAKFILGSEAKYTEGSISALSGVQGEAAYMQISVPVQPGNSGGPLVNYEGGVVGVIVSTAAVEAFFKVTGSLPQNVNWAVKSDYVRLLVEEAAVRPSAADRAEAIARVQKAVCEVASSY